MNKPQILLRTTEEWCQVLERVLPWLSPWQIATMATPQSPANMTDNTTVKIAMVSAHINVENDQECTLKQQQINNKTASVKPLFPPPTFETEVWHDVRTFRLFTIEENDDVRDAGETVIDMMTVALTKDVSVILTIPHKSMAEEIIPELELLSKTQILQLAYMSAIEKYEQDDWTWKKCCELAVETLCRAGKCKYAVYTEMKWNQCFCKTNKWPYPYKSARSYKPWFFCNRPEAIGIAGKYLGKDLQELCVEKTTEHFQGGFLEEILRLEYKANELIDNESKQEARCILLDKS